LTALTRKVASAAAVIGRSFDFDLLTAVTETGPDDVAGALRELQEAYLVLPGADAVTFDFRHALIRDALYADTGLPLRRRLHERVARAAVERGYRGAFISAHFEQARRPALAYEYAVAAAHEASGISAHGEALELCRRAARERARLHSAMAAAYLTDAPGHALRQASIARAPRGGPHRGGSMHPAQTEPSEPGRRRWAVLAVVSAAQFLTVLDLWVVN